VHKSKVRSLSVVLAALLIVGVFAAAAGAQTRFLSLSTGGPGGVYFPLGGAMADLLSRHMPGVIVTAESTAASVENVPPGRQRACRIWAWCWAASRTNAHHGPAAL